MVVETDAVVSSAPPPVLLILSVWLGGFGPPWMPLKISVAVVELMVGGLVTVRDTLAVRGATPGAVKVTAPLYVPFGRPVGFAETVIVLGVEPELGEMLSQLPPEVVDGEAIQLSVATPMLVTEMS